MTAETLALIQSLGLQQVEPDPEALDCFRFCLMAPNGDTFFCLLSRQAQAKDILPAVVQAAAAHQRAKVTAAWQAFVSTF